MGWKWKRVKTPDTPGEIRDRERRKKRRAEVDAMIAAPTGPMTKGQRGLVVSSLRHRAKASAACARNASSRKEAMLDVADAIAFRVAANALRRIKL